MICVLVRMRTGTFCTRFLRTVGLAVHDNGGSSFAVAASREHIADSLLSY
jgi:hypothetical protein